MIMKAEDLALRIEAHVSSSFLIYGIKALHLTKESALANDFFYDAVEILKSKGYAVRDSNFLSKSRLPLGESIGFEISLQIDEMLNKASKEYFLILLKNTIASSEAGETFKLDRPNKQLDKDFWSAIYKLSSIGVGINQKFSDFADDYTCFEFTWPDQKVNNMQDNDNTIETIFDDKVIVGSKRIKKTWPRDKVFDVKLTEDDIDMCVHAINELCEDFIKNDGISIRDARIQPYLELTSKLNRLFIDQK